MCVFFFRCEFFLFTWIHIRFICVSSIGMVTIRICFMFTHSNWFLFYLFVQRNESKIDFWVYAISMKKKNDINCFTDFTIFPINNKRKHVEIARKTFNFDAIVILDKENKERKKIYNTQNNKIIISANEFYGCCFQWRQFCTCILLFFRGCMWIGKRKMIPHISSNNLSWRRSLFFFCSFIMFFLLFFFCRILLYFAFFSLHYPHT